MITTPKSPIFAIVGRSNEGKTTLMATLTENDRLEISSIPGETKVSTEYKLNFDQSALSFWDTPGFQNTAETYQWFIDHAEGGGNLAKEFIQEFKNDAMFRNECEIFRPLAQGAAVIYLVDASHDIKQVDRQQLEILSLCGNPRIGLIYSKKNDGKFADNWKKLFSKKMNTRREFNSHRATFEDRKDLLKAVGSVIPEWQDLMNSAVQDLEATWQMKKRSTAEALLKLLADTLETEVLESISQDGGREVAKKEAENKLKAQVRKLEDKFRERILQIFKHSRNHWGLDASLESDLFSEEVWRILGMSKTQLVFAGAIVGAIFGGTIDAFTGGASFMMGAVLGGAIGAASAWMSAEKIADIQMPSIELPEFKVGPFKMPSLAILSRGTLGGAHVRAAVSAQSKLSSILVDRGLLYAGLASQWAHGKPGEEMVHVPDINDSKSITQSWSNGNEVRIFSNLLGQLAREPTKRNIKELNKAREEMKQILLKELDVLIDGSES